MAYDQQAAERVRQALATRSDVTEKAMMGGLSFMIGGTMCCSVSGKGGMLVRVAAADYERVLLEPSVEPAKMGDRIMRGFVRVRPEGCRTAALDSAGY
jgi:TfoX N-terminal domain